MDKTTLEIGKSGEEFAESFLLKNNYNILEKNWRSGNLEIDLICTKDNFLIIVEVKTRKSNSLVSGNIAVNKKKQQNLIYAASNYLRHKKLDMEVRFDIINVVGSDGNYTIDHIINAFSPSW